MTNCDENEQVDFEVGGSFAYSYLLSTHNKIQISLKKTLKVLRLM